MIFMFKTKVIEYKYVMPLHKGQIENNFGVE